MNLGTTWSHLSMFALQAVLNDNCRFVPHCKRYQIDGNRQRPEDQEDFTPVLTTSTVLTQVDPRLGDDEPNGFAPREN